MNLIVKLFVFLSLVGLATSRRVPKLVEVDKGKRINDAMRQKVVDFDFFFTHRQRPMLYVSLTILFCFVFLLRFCCCILLFKLSTQKKTTTTTTTSGFTGFGLPSVDMNKEEVVGDDKKNTMEVKEVKHVKSKVVKKDEGKRVGWGLNHLPTFEEIDGFE